jgi:hypothetical protein
MAEFWKRVKRKGIESLGSPFFSTGSSPKEEPFAGRSVHWVSTISTNIAFIGRRRGRAFRLDGDRSHNGYDYGTTVQ